MQYFLCNPDAVESLYPFSQIRSFSEIRISVWTIAERYQTMLANVLAYDQPSSSAGVAVFINAAYVPDPLLIKSIISLEENEVLMWENVCVAVCISSPLFKGFDLSNYPSCKVTLYNNIVTILSNPYDILRLNQLMLTDDINRLDLHDASTQLTNHNKIIGSGMVVVEEGVSITGAYLNTENGPIYLGKNVQVMEGVCIRGPVAILEDSVIKMGATIYGSTTIGKKCIIGGEVKNSVFFDYSNKAHHGYIGDSVIGSWCNMGAGTSCSNVKNNAGDINLWNPLLKKYVNVGMKCGVMMGDYTRTAINTSLNSGTVTGISCNIVKAGFPSKYIPDFTWNVDTGEYYQETKMLEDVHNWMKMKNEKLDEKNKHLLLQLYKERKNTAI